MILLTATQVYDDWSVLNASGKISCDRTRSRPVLLIKVVVLTTRLSDT